MNDYDLGDLQDKAERVARGCAPFFWGITILVFALMFIGAVIEALR